MSSSLLRTEHHHRKDTRLRAFVTTLSQVSLVVAVSTLSGVLSGLMFVQMDDNIFTTYVAPISTLVSIIVFAYGGVECVHEFITRPTISKGTVRNALVGFALFLYIFVAWATVAQSRNLTDDLASTYPTSWDSSNY